jgi:hypothetical protein
MTIVLALAVVAASASAVTGDTSEALKPTRVAIFCSRAGEQLGGRTKICYYECAKSEGAMTIPAYEACSRWEPSWRLNHNSQFGPRKKYR